MSVLRDRQNASPSLPSVLPHLPFAVTHGGDSAPLKTSCTAAAAAALPARRQVEHATPAARCGCECVNTRRDLGTGWAARPPASLPGSCLTLPHSEVAKSIPLKSISAVVNRDGDLHKPLSLSPDASDVQRPYHGV